MIRSEWGTSAGRPAFTGLYSRVSGRFCPDHYRLAHDSCLSDSKGMITSSFLPGQASKRNNMRLAISAAAPMNQGDARSDPERIGPSVQSGPDGCGQKSGRHRRRTSAYAPRAPREWPAHETGAWCARHLGRARAHSQDLAGNGSFDVIDEFYDEVWIYGSKSIFDTAKEYAFPESVVCKNVLLRISEASHVLAGRKEGPPRVLITTGVEATVVTSLRLI